MQKHWHRPLETHELEILASSRRHLTSSLCSNYQLKQTRDSGFLLKGPKLPSSTRVPACVEHWSRSITPIIDQCCLSGPLEATLTEANPTTIPRKESFIFIFTPPLGVAPLQSESHIHIIIIIIIIPSHCPHHHGNQTTSITNRFLLHHLSITSILTQN